MIRTTFKIPHKLICLMIMGLVIFAAQPRAALAEDPKFLPLGTGTKVLTPKKHKYPRLFPGTTQVDFFVAGTSLPGILSRNLSTACARGAFNQKLKRRYYVMVDMPDGSKKKFGFADYTGINLSDPGNRKGPNQAYLFDDDRTSQCKVYAALTEW